ncbi:extracellular solute-binding protein [Streptomyces coelicoflavus]|uniref:extracellular solute-binding protein n=1 Tax=Streptomyces coelicoflavus TaxID=285562 RepID=UPI0036CFE954
MRRPFRAGLTACSSSGDSASDGAGGSTALDVWLMRDSVSAEFQKEFERGFEKAHPGIDLKIQIQEWEGIGEKVTAALASNDAPDVIEVGNTQVAQYAQSGGLTDFSDRVAELGGDAWLEGLAEPGSYDGKQYGIPYYAANRVVIHRTDLFEQAGVDASRIRTRDQWIAATRKLDKGGTQGIHLPGQNWYVLSGFVWDEGGDLAVKSGGEWKGGLDSPAALRAMDFYRRLQALGKGPKDSDEAQPKTADRPGAVFTGGSDLVVPAVAAHQEEAFTFIREPTGDAWQKKLAVAMSYVPNKTTLAGAVTDDPGTAAMAAGAAHGRATPNTPQWAAVEAKNPIKEYMTAVLTGKDAESAAAEASRTITETLGGDS